MHQFKTFSSNYPYDNLEILILYFSPESRILKIWNAWGDERSHVKFIVKRASTTSKRRSGENGAASETLTHKTSVSRNPSLSHRQEILPIASSGTARARRRVRRRNSTSSVGTYIFSL